MKKLILLSLFAALSWNSDAKPVDAVKAKLAGYNFLRGEAVEGLLNANQLELVHTSASATGDVKYFYVFNTTTGGFVMVSADDQAVPVFAYSKEAGFNASQVPANAATWLDNYASEIATIIEKNYPASPEISEKWAALLHEGVGTTGNKTTASAVTQLLSTKWGQSGDVSAMCPFDQSANKNAVTGCVATAMAQVMKYWNYPQKGTGYHSYNHWNYGLLSADFGNTTYQWNAMNSSLNYSTAVATLMYHAGVAVEMGYSPTSSGAYVIDATDPVSAESALRNYFGYSPSLHGEGRSSTQSWIQLLKSELDNNRPVIYAGFGSAGGHAWIADGYDKNNFFHINWGWSGLSDGYFSVDNMNPPSLGQGGGSGGFYNGQHAIIGVEPAVMASPDKYENNNSEISAHGLPVNFSNNTININTDGSTFHVTNDGDYYSIFLPVGDNYTVSARVHDAVSSGNGNAYTVDARVNFKSPGASWSTIFDDVIPTTEVKGGGTIVYRVSQKVSGTTGTYLLDVNVTRKPTGVQDIAAMGKVNIYPNPATDNISIDMGNIAKADISIVDLQGRVVMQAAHNGGQTAKLAVSTLSNGMYFVRIQSEQGTATEKISINR